MTPQQMRELANLGPLIHLEPWDAVCDALRSAADELEAKQASKNAAQGQSNGLG